jgi:1,2-diacylglycerol 3-alpha-glucosyltransferase
MNVELAPVSNPANSSTANSVRGNVQVAVLFSRLGPYHHARLKGAGSRLRVTGIEFSSVDSLYKWDMIAGADGFNRLTLFSEAGLAELSAKDIIDHVDGALNQIRPQVIAIPGWSDRGSLAALLWCLKKKVPVVVMSETTAWDFKRSWLKESLKRRVVKLCAAGLVGGRSHAEYLAQLGIKRSEIFFGYDAVDNDYFATKSAVAKAQRAELTKRYQLPDDYFLASARFVEKKNLLRLLQAYACYRTNVAKQSIVKAWDLVLLGDGPLQAAVRDQIATLQLGNHVFLHGFKQYPELPTYYGLAKAFIHASTTEQWGLVVNEAMASGLPVLVSSRCGCAADLVQEGVTGFSFDPFNIEQMASLMERYSSQPAELAVMGQAAQKHIANWGVERFADGLARAVDVALKSPKPKVSMLDTILIKFLMRRNHVE